jgi:hypothetical protein
MSNQLTLFPSPPTNAQVGLKSHKLLCKGPNCGQLIIMIYNDNGLPQTYNLSPSGEPSTPHHETCVDVQLFRKRRTDYKRALDAGTLDHDLDRYMIH